MFSRSGAAVLLIAALLGCATQRIDMGKLQQICEEGGKSFPQTADCMDTVIRLPEAADYIRRDQRISLFVAYAGALADRVRRNQMSEPEARYRLTALRSEFAARDREASDAASQALMQYAVGMERARAATSRQPINCVTGPNIIHCY